MKLEEVEEKLGAIYNMAASAQDSVRILLSGRVSSVKLTDTQKKDIKKALKASVDSIIKTATEIKEGLR